MPDLYDVIAEYETDSASVRNFCDDIYDNMFAEHFVKIRELYSRMKSDIHPVTDDELEYILSDFPLELFSIAEGLNKLRLDYELVKLKNKQKIETIRKQSIDGAQAMDLSKSQTAEYVSHQIAASMVKYEILSVAYQSVITRVENEQSFSRELIMGAKKIWDSRRSSEQANPIEPVAPELPEYKRNQYVK